MCSSTYWTLVILNNHRSENQETGAWVYYTLETLLYFLKNTDVSHPVYVRKAAVSEKLRRHGAQHTILAEEQHQRHPRRARPPPA